MLDELNNDQSAGGDSSPPMGRSSRRGVPTTTWVMSSDCLDVGTTVANNPSSSSGPVVPTSPGTAPQHSLQAEMRIIFRVVKSFEVRRALQVQRQVDRKRVADLTVHLSLIDAGKLATAKNILKSFVKRWSAWAAARAAKKQHVLWLEEESRGPLRSLSTSEFAIWSRPRMITSWTQFASPVSPFASLSPMQRWLANVHTATCKQTRSLQKLWRRSKLIRAARSIRSRQIFHQQQLLLQALYVRRCTAVDESRSWFERCREMYDVVEGLERSSIMSSFELQKQHVEHRLELARDECTARSSSLHTAWDRWCRVLREAEVLVESWRESKARHMLMVRSIMKLEALYKEAWFSRFHKEQECWFDMSASAVAAVASQAMILGPSTLLEARGVVGRGSSHRVAGKLLLSVASVSELNELLDAWYARLRHDEAFAIGSIVERCARFSLRNKLLVDRPYEDALHDQERRHRALLVKQMIKGSLLTPFRPRSSDGILSRSYMMEARREPLQEKHAEGGSFVANPTTPHTAVLHAQVDDKPVSCVRTETPEKPIESKRFSEQPIAARSPHRPVMPTRPLRIGSDGYRTGVSKQLQRAMSGCRASRYAASVYK